VSIERDADTLYAIHRVSGRMNSSWHTYDDQQLVTAKQWESISTVLPAHCVRGTERGSIKLSSTERMAVSQQPAFGRKVWRSDQQLLPDARA
jgi:hypothetical protein